MAGLLPRCFVPVRGPLNGLLFLIVCFTLFLFITVQQQASPAVEYSADMNVNEVDVELMEQFHKITGAEERPHFHMHNLYAEDTHWDKTVRSPSQKIPRIIHYVWCRKGSFTFNNFLSVLSTIRIVRPDAIYFHYAMDRYPIVDVRMYNTWLDELKYNFPWLILKAENATRACLSFRPSLSFIVSQLHQHGGMYIGLDTLLTEYEESIKPYELVVATESDSEDYALVAAKPKYPLLLKKIHSLQKLSKMANILKCPLASENMQSIKDQSCMVLGDRVRTPVELLRETTSETPLYMFFRKLFYGQETIPKMEPHEKEVVPNIGHYVWFGGGQMDYVFYLGVLSVLYVVKVDTVYIHGDKPPSGQYWQKLQEQEGDRVKWTYRPHPKQIYTTEVGRIEHAADVARHDIMLKYGGINMDADLIFNRPIDRTLFHYDTVVTLDNYLYSMDPFPDTFNLGVVMTKPHSKFWQLYQFSERYYYEDDYTWNSNRVPYKIWERNPGLLHIDNELQVICCYLKCYPTWVQTRPEAFQLSEDVTPWRNRPMAFHWTWPSPPELNNERVMRQNNSVFAQIGHRVLKAAGKW